MRERVRKKRSSGYSTAGGRKKVTSLPELRKKAGARGRKKMSLPPEICTRVREKRRKRRSRAA
jgi:hypothetical protein